MLLSEFKEYLAYGELSQLFIGDKLLTAGQFPRVISAINLGITELYKRFPIKIMEISVEIAATRNTYTISNLTGKSSMGGGDPLDYYVLDSVAVPFPNNIVKILTVSNSEGTELAVDDDGNQTSVFTRGHNVIWLPAPATDVYEFVYHAVPTTMPPCTEENSILDIPPQFIEPLVLYVAYRTFAAINMNSAEAVNYYAKFEAACALLHRDGLWHKDMRSNLRLDDNGWV